MAMGRMSHTTHNHLVCVGPVGGVLALGGNAAFAAISPVNEGEVMEISIPASRLQTCADALDLAQEAEGEAKKASPDYDYIGDRTRTLEEEYIPAIRVKFEIE